MEHNKEYARLKRENERMIISEDSITSLINIARSTFRMEHDSLANPIADIDSFSTYIIDLEQQLFDMRSKRGDIIAQINTIEQEWVLSQMFAPEDDTRRDHTHLPPRASIATSSIMRYSRSRYWSLSMRSCAILQR